MKFSESQGLRGIAQVIIYANVRNVPTVVETVLLGNAGAASPLRLQHFLHNHKLVNEHCEDLVVIRLAVIHEYLKHVAYPYTFKINGEVSEIFWDIFLSVSIGGTLRRCCLNYKTQRTSLLSEIPVT